MRNHAPYDGIVGGAFLRLDKGVRLAHSSPLVAEGTLCVRWSRSLPARVMARAMRLPPEGESVPTRLEVTEVEGVQVWARDFGGHRVVTRQWAEGPYLVEDFGSASALFRLVPEEDGLRYETVAMRRGRIRVPAFVTPKIEASIRSDEGGWHVDVSVRHPWLGMLCRYFGVMKSVEGGSRANRP